ncbi:aldo-keto reductase-like protein [Lojkania enalia]|uniref:Aldo-keto reductase-like protein n=1 Tax=Lojkania enalia TaxID=147567 RepID=A0A9P4NAG2_9PLEO|nr:aldo-keto reductase-like protein [Didymosphaeria enalia]
MESSSLEPDGVRPGFIYGTAWKKDRTKGLVKEALGAGFRAVDTAAQPRHYQEDLVGEGLREAYAAGIVKREDLHIQTKYTSPAGQDLHNMPYQPTDPLETQIRTSVASSLKNLRPNEDSEVGSYIDCLLLHSPLQTIQQTLQVWQILEAYVPDKIRYLGISNVSLPILQVIQREAKVKPSVVQNRFYPATKYDAPLRAFCCEHGIKYQSFWTLTGNPKLLSSDPVSILGKAVGLSNSIALYALVMDLGIVVLNGTTSAQHMGEDLAGIKVTREWAKEHVDLWGRITDEFGSLIEP